MLQMFEGELSEGIVSIMWLQSIAGGARIQVVGGIANRGNIALGLVSSWTDNHEMITFTLSKSISCSKGRCPYDLEV